MITGRLTGWPMTVVARSRLADSPATCGAKPSSLNALTLSLTVRPFSEPATSAPYTDLGRRFFARRCATATVSNHALAICLSSPAHSLGEQPGYRRGDVAVPDGPGQPPAPEPGQVARQLLVVLTRGVEQHIQAGQPGRRLPGIRPGVVHAVRQQQDARVPGRDRGQLAPGDLQREPDVGEPSGR